MVPFLSSLPYDLSRSFSVDLFLFSEKSGNPVKLSRHFLNRLQLEPKPIMLCFPALETGFFSRIRAWNWLMFPRALNW